MDPKHLFILRFTYKGLHTTAIVGHKAFYFGICRGQQPRVVLIPNLLFLVFFLPALCARWHTP